MSDPDTVPNQQPPRRGGWQPGVSGNPAGRPRRGETFKDCLHRIAEEDGNDARTRKERICRKMEELAENGNLAAAAWVVERIEGKAIQSVEVSRKADLLQGLTDAEVMDLIDAIKRKQLPASDNNANVGT